MIVVVFFSSTATLTAQDAYDFSRATWKVGTLVEAKSAAEANRLFGQVPVKAPISGSSLSVQAIDGVVSLSKVFNQKPNSIANASLTFNSTGGEHSFSLGSTHAMQVWLNGVLSAENLVDRELNNDDDEVRVQLKTGNNNIVVRLLQTTGNCSFAVSLRRMEPEECGLNAAKRVYFTFPNLDSHVSAGQDLVFTVQTTPPLAISVPFDFKLTSQDGKVLALGQRLTETNWTIPLSTVGSNLLKLTITPALNMDKIFASKFGPTPVFQYFTQGDRDTVMRQLATKAQKVARTLSASSDPGDVATSLLFLAERLQGKLHPSLMRDQVMSAVIGDTAEYLAAAAKGRIALANLRGHRQMAYRSNIDGSLQPYSIYLPANYDPQKKYSLLACLHGMAWDDYTDVALVAPLKLEDFIVIGIQGRGDLMYKGIGEQDVLDVLDRVSARYSIDANKVYLRGYSMGGFGAWHLAQRYPDRFAAIAVFSGYTGIDFIPNVINVPALVVNGALDVWIPVMMPRRATSLQKSLGGAVDYYEFPEVGHNAWENWQALKGPDALYDFFRGNVRNPSPSRIAALIPTLRHAKHYWLQVHELDTTGPLID
ncbi:MAG: hypothetical protein H7246_19465, partial [Phycisphaerae bacterium]|nr:hypothetical protein [Saprospiraceae bacterium]